MKEPSSFERLAAINVNAQVEKKGNLSYLSWAWAVDHLLREDPDAKWSYGDVVYFANRTAMITCTVIAFGKSRSMQLPVMDHRNKAIIEPDSFAINTAMQRCLVKAIALHGLGLYIYAGEDLPPGEAGEAGEADDKQDVLDPTRPNTAIQTATDAWDLLSLADQKYCTDLAITVTDMVENKEVTKAHEYIEAQKLSLEQRMGVWHVLKPRSDVRSALQKAARPAPVPRAPKLVPPPLASQP